MNHFLHFTSRERSGILCLLLLNGLLWLAPEVWRRLSPMQVNALSPRWAVLEAEMEVLPKPSLIADLFYFDPNKADTADLKKLGLPRRVVRNIAKFREKGGRFKKPEDLKRIYGLSSADYQRLAPYIRWSGPEKQQKEKEEAAKEKQPEQFPFDPLTVSGAALGRLGLSPLAVKAFLSYREKGGRIRNARDLARIYGIGPGEVERLAPLIQISEEPPPAKNIESAKIKNSRLPSSLDINQADTSDWQSLPGIGPAFSARIVRYRDKLGGFLTVEQVAETFGLPDSVFQKIQPYLRPSPIFRPLLINQIDEAHLREHPYLNWRQARAVVAYRQEHGPFTSAADLCKVQALPQGLCEKLAAYCRWDP